MNDLQSKTKEDAINTNDAEIANRYGLKTSHITICTITTPVYFPNFNRTRFFLKMEKKKLKQGKE